MTKSNLNKKSVTTSSLLRHQKRHQTNVTRFIFWAPPNQNFWLRHGLLINL